MTASYPRIPYGEASFRRIRVNGWLYVDKTRYLRPLEDERYVFFIRPRRFGKSCWLSLLECYYGRHWAHEFEALFGGTDIGRAPTADRGRYVVVRFDFSAFNDKLETLEERFEGILSSSSCAMRWNGIRTCSPSRRSGVSSPRPPSTASSASCSSTPTSTVSRSISSSTSTTTSPTRSWRTGGGRRMSRSPTAGASTATSSPP